MRQAILRSTTFAAWLLCATIVWAAIDPAPDPPAVRPHGIEAMARCLGDFQSSPVQALRCVSSFADPGIEVRWTFVRLVLTSQRPIDLIAAMRRAADQSPPAHQS